MFPAMVRVERMLPIDGVLLDDVLLRLRRDSTASALRWTLGSRGAAEVDTAFERRDGAWTTSIRLWKRGGLAVTAALLELAPAGSDSVRLTLEPTVPAAPAWGEDGRDLEVLARAAADELSEELLWHASRADLTRRG